MGRVAFVCQSSKHIFTCVLNDFFLSILFPADAPYFKSKYMMLI